MIALTFHQPWATLMAFGAKRFETRSWRPEESRADASEPFKLALHAGKHVSAQDREWYEGELPSLLRLHPDAPGARGLAAVLERYPTYGDLPRGAIVGGCRIVHCHRTEDLLPNPIAELAPPEMALEAHLGLYDRGRWAWEADTAAYLVHPIPARGHQRLWWWQPPNDIRQRCEPAPPRQEAA